MSNPPKFIRLVEKPKSDLYAWIECPTCGLEGLIDKEQFEGLVSIWCPDCEYHETHDLRNSVDV